MRHMLALALALVLLGGLACQSSPEVKPDQELADKPAASGPTCPDKPTIRPVIYDTFYPDDKSMDEGLEDPHYWLFVHMVPLDVAENPFFGKAGSSQSLNLKEVSAKELNALGIATSEDPVWLLPVEGGAPCQMKPGPYYATHRGDGVYFTSVYRKLEGACGSGDAYSPLALQGGPEMKACRWRPGPSRYGEDTPEPNNAYQARLEGMTLPAELIDALDARKCVEPECELKWLHLTSDAHTSGVKVHEFVVTRIHKDGRDEECNWESENFHHILATYEGQPPTRLRSDYGGYSGMLYDEAGVRALVARDLGHVRTWTPPGDGRAGELYQDLEWFIPHEEDHMPVSLGPYCGP